MAYAKHQSFYLKSNWINKGLKAVRNNPIFFSDTNNFLEIGIGKNMFLALKYWLEALNLIEFNGGQAQLTEFGTYVYENDLSCTKPLTLNLLHYFLVSKVPFNNAEVSTGFYWFFNIDNSRLSKKQDLLSELVKWDTITFHRNTSEKTIERDLDCLVLCYTKAEKTHPEDKNTSILANLNLLTRNKDVIQRNAINRKLISMPAFMYLLLKQIENIPNSSHSYLSLNDLLEEEMSPGKLFHLGRVDLIETLEEMINTGYPIQIVRTNNLDTISISRDMNSQDYLTTILR